VPRWSVPYPLALAAAHASEAWSNLVSGRPPKASVTGVKLARRLMHFDARRSLAELGLEPRPVRQSLADAVDWLAAVGQIQGPRRQGAIKAHAP
jgi:dihydroflavonol-4-reductase